MVRFIRVRVEKPSFKRIIYCIADEGMRACAESVIGLCSAKLLCATGIACGISSVSYANASSTFIYMLKLQFIVFTLCVQAAQCCVVEAQLQDEFFF